MKRAAYNIVAFLLSSVFATQAWGFAFNVFQNNRLTTSDSGVPIIWQTQSVEVGIGISQTYKPYVLEAINEWNNTGANVSLVDGNSYASPCLQGDRLNSIGFTANACGKAWGDAVGLTIMRAMITPDGNYVSEADVMIRSFSGEPKNHWTTPDDPNNSNHRSCYENTQKGITCDFRRVVLHELGHALGLAHPDEHKQNVTAVMNSGSSPSNIIPPNLAADDKNGIRTLYKGDRVIVDGAAGLQKGASTSKSDYSVGSAAVDVELLLVLFLFMIALRLQRSLVR